MSKVTVIQVVFNSRRFIEPVFNAIFNQTFQDFRVVAVISGNDDKGKELLQEKFPKVEIIDLGCNIGFAKGHNLVFEKYCTLTRPSDGHPLPSMHRGEGNNENASEFFQLVNPDLILEPNYIEEMLKVFDDEKVGAATGKLLKYDFEYQRKTDIIDTTGVVIYKSGRACDRGQYEEDKGQYNSQKIVRAVSAAGAMYRREALEAVKLSKFDNPSPARLARGSLPSLGERNNEKAFEYFDEDFHSYWEDVDLTWRMTNRGWKCAYQPSAIGYHGRSAGSSPGGYKKVYSFVKFHRKLSARIRQLNYKNHIFMYIKNSPSFYPQFFIREFFMFCYILLFETGTLKVLPQFFKILPKIWKKRKLIQSLS